MKLFLLIFFTYPLFVFSQTSESTVKDKAYSREWLTLLHYKKSFLGYRSEVDSEHFFYHRDGKGDPLKEMEANIIEMTKAQEVGPNHPQCIFPARYKYLKETFNLDVKDIECTDYLWWRKNLPFHSVTVIFASYYANNPASMFGHTFLRINSTDKKNISDYGVDFSAISNTDHGIEFALRGLLGGYTGLYSIKPYYMKLNTYIENENRDLWEYDLNLTDSQIDKLLTHLWELMRYGQFDYYFLTENCSYQILTLLEVANPNLHLSDEFVWKTIPIDTVKAIKKAGIITDVRYRPAYKKTVLLRQQLLNSSEFAELKEITSFKRSPKDVHSAKVLEAATATLRYERFEEKKFTLEQERLLRDLLVQRAAVGGKVEYPDVVDTLPLKKLRPDVSHDSEKYSLSVGNNSALPGIYTELGLKASFHDFLDIDNGYPKHSSIETGNLKVRYSGENKNLYFQELKYAEAVSLFPLDGYEFKWSWRAGLKTYRVYDGSCDLCVSTQLKSGGGLAKNLGFIDMDVYSMVLFNGELSNGFYRGYRLAPGLNLGMVWTIQERLKGFYEFELYKDLNETSAYRDFRRGHQAGLGFNIDLQQELRLFGQIWETMKEGPAIDEIQFSYSFYY